MRTWVEKLAKAIERGGNYKLYDIRCFTASIAIPDYKIFIHTATSTSSKWLSIVHLPSLMTSDIKLYDDEYDLLIKVEQLCKNRSQDYIINHLNELN